MATAEHKHPNYMAIFWYLAILTVTEIAVIYVPLAKFTIGVLLCALALGKAVLVAMYFMHLRFETRTLGMVAVTPLAIATLSCSCSCRTGSRSRRRARSRRRPRPRPRSPEWPARRESLDPEP